MSLNLSQGPTLAPVFRTDAEIDRRDEWVRKINDAATDPRTSEVRVEGYTVVLRFGRPATRWGNGTVSVRVEAKKPGRTRELFFKLGAVLPAVTIETKGI